MIGRGEEHHRSYSAHMVGKIDRAGRLTPDELVYANQPNHLFWREKKDACRSRLIELIGPDAHDCWLANPSIPDLASYKTHAEIYAEKIQEIETCGHEWVTSTFGGRYMTGGDYDEDIEEETWCRHCGALLKIAQVRE